MMSSRQNNRSNLEKLNLERKVDQFIDAGIQFVDGVSGARPGKRRSSSIKELSRRKVNNVTKWVSKRVDSIFDDEDLSQDDWEYYYGEKPKNMVKNRISDPRSFQDEKIFKKRPLTAISLRQSEIKPKSLKPFDQDWPEAEAFQVNRWKRDSLKYEESNLQSNNTEKTNIKVRNLPKSSRRRI